MSQLLMTSDADCLIMRGFKAPGPPIFKPLHHRDEAACCQESATASEGSGPARTGWSIQANTEMDKTLFWL